MYLPAGFTVSEVASNDVDHYGLRVGTVCTTDPDPLMKLSDELVLSTGKPISCAEACTQLLANGPVNKQDGQEKPDNVATTEGKYVVVGDAQPDTPTIAAVTAPQPGREAPEEKEQEDEVAET